MFAIEGVKLARSYGSFRALKEVDIAVPVGQIRGLIGPNGAGKSTLIDVLSGRADNVSGVVKFDGRDITALKAQQRRQLGLSRSFQRTNIFPQLPVREQLELASYRAEVQNVDEVMEEFGLAHLAERMAVDISYGDQRRLDLALALVGRPKVLLLDEPAAGLTMNESLTLATHLKELVSRWKVTVIIVEHDMDVVFSICDQITVLHLGALLAEGPPEQIRRMPEVVTAYLGERRMTPLLTFEDVDSGYGKARILHGLSLSIGANESVAILGRNGVGKTTFVNTFLGVANLFRGTVALTGQRRVPIRNFDAARAGISVVLQGRGLFSNLSVRENLIMGTAPRRKGRWTLDTVFDLFPILRERAETSGTALSGGQQQMLAIGRALMANPALLVLDEPSEGLAPVIIDELVDVFKRLAAAGTSLLLIEQNYSIVKRVSERYYVLSKGSIVEQGSLEGLTMESIKKHVSV